MGGREDLEERLARLEAEISALRTDFRTGAGPANGNDDESPEGVGVEGRKERVP